MIISDNTFALFCLQRDPWAGLSIRGVGWAGGRGFGVILGIRVFLGDWMDGGRIS